MEAASFYVHTLRTRFPFAYGIAQLTELPHLCLRLEIRIDGIPVSGLAAEHLPPKWFTKDPHTTFSQDLPGLLQVNTRAAESACALGREPQTFFTLWQNLARDQAAWADRTGVPHLLAQLGVSMVERALLDALCRFTGHPFDTLVRANLLDLDLGALHRELAGVNPGDVLPAAARSRVALRHTVGLSDPLDTGDLVASQALHDGLPHTLRQNIAAYGLRYFKIKLAGDLEIDGVRLHRLHALFQELLGEDYHFTLDGNENYGSVEHFIDHWEHHRQSSALRNLFTHLLFVEQPLHRTQALQPKVGQALRRWANGPPLVIDESDSCLDDLPRALGLGYAGTSHKNCKGVLKGLANAALLEQRRRQHPGRPTILSGEDLANIGPIALLQDLAVMATLGIPHVERNGHHYFRGLSAFPEDLQRALISVYPDLYAWNPDVGGATLQVKDGHISTRSATRSGFGLVPPVALDAFCPLASWRWETSS